VSVSFPEVRVGEPVRYGAVSVFPLFADQSSEADYLLSDEGLASGEVSVCEVSEAGSVPGLLVENLADKPVLFVKGAIGLAVAG